MIMATTETTIGTATVRVWPSGQVGEYGKAGWAYSIREHAADGAVTTIATGADLYGHGDGPEMLRSLCSFLAADADRYRSVMGPITDPHDDGYLFGEAVAEWAYMNDDALALAALELDDDRDGE